MLPSMTEVGPFKHDMGERGGPPDLVVASMAAGQDGVVSYAQLVAAGLGRGAIHRRARNSRLHRVHPGVYAVGHPGIGYRGRLWAALLYCGPEAVLSHRSAAFMHHLTVGGGSLIHVTVPGSHRTGRPGLVVHRTRNLAAADTGVVDGLPVTSVARTVLDFADGARDHELVRILEQAQRLRVFDMRSFEELLERSRGRRGVAALRRAMAELADDAPDVRSKLERRFLAFCRNRNLLEPALNAVIEGYTVDAAWPAQKLIAELDSYSYHGQRRSFEEDRKRDMKLQLARQRVVRITDRRLRHEADELECELRALLAG